MPGPGMRASLLPPPPPPAAAHPAALLPLPGDAAAAARAARMVTKRGPILKKMKYYLSLVRAAPHAAGAAGLS